VEYDRQTVKQLLARRIHRVICHSQLALVQILQRHNSRKHWTLRYDTTKEINVDSKAKCIQLNLANVARKKYEKEETKTNERQT